MGIISPVLVYSWYLNKYLLKNISFALMHLDNMSEQVKNMDILEISIF